MFAEGTSPERARHPVIESPSEGVGPSTPHRPIQRNVPGFAADPFVAVEAVPRFYALNRPSIVVDEGNPLEDLFNALTVGRPDVPITVVRHEVASMATDEQYASGLKNLPSVFGDVQSPESIRSALDAICIFFAEESTSDKQQVLNVSYVRGGRLYRTTSDMLRTVCQPTVRSFMRRLANYTRDLLARRGGMTRYGKQLGFPPNMSTIAFDYAEYCTDLSENQRAFLRKVRGNQLYRSLDIGRDTLSSLRGEGSESPSTS